MQLWLDPFMGNGTTAIACLNLNRQFIGFEIDEDMAIQAQERVLNHTPTKSSIGNFSSQLPLFD